MSPLTKQKWEIFAQNAFLGKSAGECAVIAGYSPKSCRSIGPRLMQNVEILKRITELQEKAADKKIMTVQERKIRLSEIARTNLTNFMELGKDGSWVNIGPESEGTGAIAEIHSRTEYDDDSEKPTVYTTVKLHDPIKAIAELNKMEGIGKGEAPKVDVTVNIGEIDARSRIIALVDSAAARIGTPQDHQQLVREGSSGVPLRLAGESESEPATP